MASVQNTYDQLIQKLDSFIRKYYLNQVIRGSLYWVGLCLAIFLLYSFLEHEFFFDRGVRKFFLFSFIGLSTLSFLYWIGNPLLHFFRLGQVISHEQAASIIGSHFANVEDRLLNILQLRKQADNASDPGLILAGIEQKTEQIRLVPFQSAINLSKNRKYLRYALPPLLLLLVLLVAAPTMIKDSTHRILHNNQDFEKAAPFRFVVQGTDDLKVPQYEDFLLQVTTEGEIAPEEVFIDLEGYSYRLRKQKDGSFTYRFTNVQDNQPFSFYSGDIRSRSYELKVIRKPSVVSFDITLDYPRYTGRKDDVLSNIGDLVIPEGTRVSWQYQTIYTNALEMVFPGSTDAEIAERRGTDLYTLQKTIYRDQPYSIVLSNDQLPHADSVRYQISVVPDLFPEIDVERFIDSADQKMVYFVGNTSDDYGISKLRFQYNVADDKGVVMDGGSTLLDLKHARQFQYAHVFDMRNVELKPGFVLSYFFEVTDNDAINGSKSSRTAVMEYRMPTLEEFEEKEAKNSEDIKDKLDKARKESQRLQEEMQKLREKLLQERDLNWQNKKNFEKLLDRQQEKQNDIRNSMEMFRENLENQMEFSNPSEDIQEKQEKLNEFFEDMEDEKMEELREKFQELFEEMDKDKALEMMEQFEMNEEQMEMDLERLLELYKQMELEYELEKQMEKLLDLAEEQEQLSEETKESEGDNTEQLQQEQEDIRNELEEISKEMESLEQKNKELERPKDMEGAMDEMEKIDQDMENSMDQLQQGKNQKASESQKSAAQRMRDMAQQMSSQMQAGQMEQMQADMKMLRQLIENLVTLSFDQEDLIAAFNNTNTTTPRYVSLVQDQFRIKDDFKVAEDSLMALSKRVFQIESFITEKVFEIKEELKTGIENLEDRKKPEASENQHRTMKSLNDLALMLSEVMQQMQQQMSMMMPGNQMCNNPKPGGQGGANSRVPMDKITEGQQKLNEDMKGKMQQQGKGQEGVSSEDFARMAARQAALRKALRELAEEKQQRGQGDKGLNDLLEEMDKIETDLVNKRLTNEMLRRQQEILTRLLEAERAEREREMDNKRKSEVAEQKETRMPPALEKYLKEREADIDLYQTVSPSLRPYYRFLVEEYYNALKSE